MTSICNPVWNQAIEELAHWYERDGRFLMDDDVADAMRAFARPASAPTSNPERTPQGMRIRAEVAEAALVEMTRRRDAWRQKAAGYDELAAAVRKGVADAGPRDLGRIFLRGALVEQAHRIDDLQAIVAKVAAGPAWGDSISQWCDRMMLDARAALPASQPTAAPTSPPAES